MQKYAIVVYDKRNGDDLGTSLRPLSLILLPKPGSEK